MTPEVSIRYTASVRVGYPAPMAEPRYLDYDNGRMLICEECGVFVHPGYEETHSVFHLTLDIAASSAKLAIELDEYHHPKKP